MIEGPSIDRGPQMIKESMIEKLIQEPSSGQQVGQWFNICKITQSNHTE